MISVALMEGKLVGLRTPEPNDLETLLRLEKEAPSDSPCRGEVMEFIRRGTYRIYTDGWMRLMIEAKESQVGVGTIDLTSFDSLHLRAEVSIVVDSDYCRRGYATEALQLIERYANEFLHLRQLYARVSMKNVASLGLFSKLGYERGEVDEAPSDSPCKGEIVVVLRKMLT